MRQAEDPADSGWVGAGPDDDLEARLAAEEASEPFDRRRPHVMTVLGPIEPAALGVGLVVRSLVSGQASASVPAGDGDPLAVVAALEEFYAVGGRAIIDLAADRTGRELLDWIAARSPVHLVAVGAPPLTDRGSPEERGLVSDHNPRDGGEARSSEVGASLIDIKRLHSSSVEMGRDVETGGDAAAYGASRLPILLRGGGEGVALAVARLAAEGVAPERIIALGLDEGWREADRRAVLAAGAFAVVEVDASEPMGRNPAEPADRIAALVRGGFGDRLLLGIGGSATATTRAGAPASSDLLERFPLRLMEAGLGAPAVRSLLVENLARALTIPGGAGEGDGDGRG